MNTITVLIIPANWDTPVKLLKIEPTLEKFQELVGGYIEEINCAEGAGFVCEIGKDLGLPKNHRATSYGDKTRMIDPDDHFVGDVVLFGSDSQANPADVSPAVIEAIEKITGQLTIPASCEDAAMDTTQQLQAVLNKYIEPRFHEDEIIRRHCQMLIGEDLDPQDRGEPVTDWVELEPDANDGPSYVVSARSLNMESFHAYVDQRLLEIRYAELGDEDEQ